MGEAVTRLPPIVARLRIWREPNTRSMSASAGNSPAICSSICVSVTAAPMRHSESVHWISFSSGTASTEMSVGNFLKRLRDVEPQFGGAGDEPGLGESAKQLQQAGERSRPEESLAGKLVFDSAKSGGWLLQPLGE